MSGDFFDTNVLLYLLSGDAAKADRAEALVRKGGRISVQVMNEAANVMRRKLRMSWRETREFLALAPRPAGSDAAHRARRTSLVSNSRSGTASRSMTR